jgi:hypothetical protein
MTRNTVVQLQLARRYSCIVEKNLQVVPVTVHKVVSLMFNLISSNGLMTPLSENDRVVIVIAAMHKLDICASREEVSDVPHPEPSAVVEITFNYYGGAVVILDIRNVNRGNSGANIGVVTS